MSSEYVFSIDLEADAEYKKKRKKKYKIWYLLLMFLRDWNNMHEIKAF